MANRHYAKIGDVWKHLALAQLRQTQAPAAYWESHAGAADYVLTHSLVRNYGAYYFFYNAHRSERLLRTPYYEILRSLASGVDEPRTYPGSPLIAMRVLKDAASRFLFCDVDQDSLSTIHRRADELKLAARVETEQGNGVTTLGREISVRSLADAPRIFAHMDPYLPFTNDDDGRDTVDVFCELTAKGALVMMWYGFSSDDEAAVLMKEIRAVSAAHRMRPPITGSGVVRSRSQLCMIPISTSTQALWAAAFFAATSPRMPSCLARSWGRSWVASTPTRNSLTDPQVL